MEESELVWGQPPSAVPPSAARRLSALSDEDVACFVAKEMEDTDGA